MLALSLISTSRVQAAAPVIAPRVPCYRVLEWELPGLKR